MESTIVVKKYYGQWLLAKSTCWNLTFSDYVNWNAVTPNATSNPGPSLNFRGRPQCFQSTTGSKVLISFASFVNYYSYQNDHICHWITSQAFLLKLSWRVHSLPVSTWLAKPQLLTWRLIDLPNFPLGVTQFMKLTYLERKNIYFLAFQLNFNHTNMFLWIQEANAVVHKQSSLPHSDTPPPCIILLGGIVPLQERTSLISEQSLFFSYTPSKQKTHTSMQEPPASACWSSFEWTCVQAQDPVIWLPRGKAGLLVDWMFELEDIHKCQLECVFTSPVF